MSRSTNLAGVALWTIGMTSLLLGDGTFAVTDPAKVYYGDPGEFENPAVLTASAVFAKIREWREIQEKGLTSQDPEYWILLEKANRKFRRAVHRVAQEAGHDLVAETGAVVRADGAALPDVTEAAIAALDKD